MKLILNKAIAMARGDDSGSRPRSVPCGALGTPRDTGGLVVRAVGLGLAGAEGWAFVRRRAEAELALVKDPAERRLLGKLLDAARPGYANVFGAVRLLAAYAALLEGAGRFEEAADALRQAVGLFPDSAELALRAARVARLAGDVERAARLYARVRELDDGTGHWSRLAAVGDALLAVDPMAALSRAARAAVRAGDADAAGLALEERAEARLASGDTAGAVRDLCVAALRFRGASDRERVARRLGDVLVARSGAGAARAARNAIESLGDGSNRATAASRLRAAGRFLYHSLAR